MKSLILKVTSVVYNKKCPWIGFTMNLMCTTIRKRFSFDLKLGRYYLKKLPQRKNKFLVSI